MCVSWYGKSIIQDLVFHVAIVATKRFTEFDLSALCSHYHCNLDSHRAWIVLRMYSSDEYLVITWKWTQAPPSQVPLTPSERESGIRATANGTALNTR